MGIHTWNGYFEYENRALKSYIETIERFCSECHTNEDYGRCEDCPTGKFIGQLRKYLLEIPESDILKDQARILQKIKQLLKKMPDLHPLYLPVDEDYKFNSVFNNLKKLSFELNLWEECFHRESEWKMHISDIRGLGKKMKKIKKKEVKKKRNKRGIIDERKNVEKVTNFSRNKKDEFFMENPSKIQENKRENEI